MKNALIDFFSSNHMIALLSSVLIFFITLFLVAKRWIGFSFAFILLLISLVVGALINNPQFFSDYIDPKTSTNALEQQNEFKKMILQALNDVKHEMEVEKQNIAQLKEQLNEIVSQMDSQKQKLESFIEETRHKFQTENSEAKLDENKEPITEEITS